MENINELLERCRHSDIVEAATIMSEVLTTHACIAWNPTTKHLDEVVSVSINGDAIQFNLQQYDAED